MKSRTYLLVILSILAFWSQTAKAQEIQDKKAHEIYLYGNLKELTLTGITFKSEIKTNRFFRIGATNLDYSNQIQNHGDPQSSKSLSFAGGIQVGLENRVKLTEKLSAYYGVDLNTSFTYMKSESEGAGNTSRISAFRTGFSFGSGFILNVVKNLSISLELEPAVLISFTSSESQFQSITTKYKTTYYIFDFDIDDVKLALVYRW
jgi:opacity protein-like surface antigen